MLEREEVKVGKTSLRVKLPVWEQIETSDQWWKREGCKWEQNSKSWQLC